MHVIILLYFSTYLRKTLMPKAVAATQISLISLIQHFNCLSTWNNTTATRSIFVGFYTGDFYEHFSTSCIFDWNQTKVKETLHQGPTKYLQIGKPPQNCHTSDMTQILYLRTNSIWCHHTKLRCLGDLVPWICAPMCYTKTVYIHKIQLTPCDMCRQEQRGGRGTAPIHLQPGIRRKWAVSTIQWLLYLQGRPSTHCMWGWVGIRAHLHGTEHLVLNKIEFLDRPACGEWLYWLRHSGCHIYNIVLYKY